MRESVMGFVAGTLVGAFMGCATVLLFTPRTGRQMRNSISKEARRLATKAYKGFCRHAVDAARALVQDQRQIEHVFVEMGRCSQVGGIKKGYLLVKWACQSATPSESSWKVLVCDV